MLRMRLTGGYSRSCDGIVSENNQYRASIRLSRSFYYNVDLLACALPDDVKFPRKYSLLLASPPTSEREETGGKKVIHSILFAQSSKHKWKGWQDTVLSLSCHDSPLRPLPLVPGVVVECADEGRRLLDDDDARLLSVLTLMAFCPGDSLVTGFFFDACFNRVND